MKFVLIIDCENDAFEGCLEDQVGEILLDARTAVKQLSENGVLVDGNGNACGRFVFCEAHDVYTRQLGEDWRTFT